MNKFRSYLSTFILFIFLVIFFPYNFVKATPAEYTCRCKLCDVPTRDFSQGGKWVQGKCDTTRDFAVPEADCRIENIGSIIAEENKRAGKIADKIVSECLNMEPAPYCCCKQQKGEQITSVTCEKITGRKVQTCDSYVYEHPSEGPPTRGDQSIKIITEGYLPKPIVDGGCTANEGAGTTEGAEFDTLQAVRQTAAGTLNPMRLTSPNQIIGWFIMFFSALMGGLSMIMYIWAGVLWMTAAGNSERTSKARHIMLWTTLTVIVELSAYMLVKFVLGLMK